VSECICGNSDLEQFTCLESDEPGRVNVQCNKCDVIAELQLSQHVLKPESGKNDEVQQIQSLIAKLNKAMDVDTASNASEKVLQPAEASSMEYTEKDTLDVVSKCEVSYEVLNPKWTSRVLDDLQDSKVTSEVLDDFPESDPESLCYVQCEMCGHNDPNKWREIACDADGIFIEFIPCNQLFKIPKKYNINFKPESSKALSETNRRLESQYINDMKTPQRRTKLYQKSKKQVQTRVMDLSILKPGDHIEWHRNIGFYHHAIVEEVDIEKNCLNVIEYTGEAKRDSDGNFASVRRTVCTFNKTGEDMMFRIDYDPDICGGNPRARSKSHRRGKLSPNS